MAKKMSVAEVRTEYKRKLRKAFKEYPVLYYKLVDCLEKCLIYGHIRRFAN